MVPRTLKRKTLVIIFAVAAINILAIYLLLLLSGMERRAEMWAVWMVCLAIIVVGIALSSVLFDYVGRRLAKRLSRYQCPVCATVYDGKLQHCPNCGNRTM